MINEIKIKPILIINNDKTNNKNVEINFFKIINAVLINNIANFFLSLINFIEHMLLINKLIIIVMNILINKNKESIVLKNKIIINVIIIRNFIKKNTKNN